MGMGKYDEQATVSQQTPTDPTPNQTTNDSEAATPQENKTEGN